MPRPFCKAPGSVEGVEWFAPARLPTPLSSMWSLDPTVYGVATLRDTIPSTTGGAMPNLADLSIALIVLMTAGLIGCAQVPPDRHDRCPSQRLVSLVEKTQDPRRTALP